MADGLIALLQPHAALLAAAVAADLALGDPAYRAHPVRLIGTALGWLEAVLRRAGADGYGGGIALFVILAAISIGTVAATVAAAAAAATWAGWLAHAFLLYSFLALGDLLRHVWRIERALGRDGLNAARAATAALVGRDVARMDAAACRRAGIESLSENLTDGFTSALFWYAIGGLPGLTLFKVVSTMDSMVGYRTPRYLRFGWCGARMDDVMNYVPARATWLLMAATAAFVPRCSGIKALRIGWRQHAILPGPNAGWSEAAAAGAIERRLAGPIWAQGRLVTDTWIGDPCDPPASSRDDVVRAITVVAATGVLATLVALFAI